MPVTLLSRNQAGLMRTPASSRNFRAAERTCYISGCAELYDSRPNPLILKQLWNPTLPALPSQLNHPVTAAGLTNTRPLAEQALRNVGSEVEIRARAVAMRAAAVAGHHAAIAIRASAALHAHNLILLRATPSPREQQQPGGLSCNLLQNQEHRRRFRCKQVVRSANPNILWGRFLS